MTPRKGSSIDYADVEAQLRAIERGGGEGELSFGRGARLPVSSLGKAFFPGITKGDLMRYYTRVAPALLPEIDGSGAGPEAVSGWRGGVDVLPAECR